LEVYVDNYLEAPHPHRHPLDEGDRLRAVRTDTFAYYSQQFAPIRAMKAGDAGERLTSRHRLRGSLLLGFPEPVLNIYPDNISTNVIVPSPRKTLTIFEWFFTTSPRKNQERIKRSVAFVRVQQEICLCKNVNVDCALRPMTADAIRQA